MTARIPWRFGKPFAYFLVLTGILSSPTAELEAATQSDTELEASETTYRVNSDNTADVLMHQRWKALTAQGRNEISQIELPYVPFLEDLKITSINTVKKDGSVVMGDPAGGLDAAPSVEPLTLTFTDTRLKILLPPNLETGDSVEFEAVRHVREWQTPGNFWFMYYPVKSIPVLSETVVLDLPVGSKTTFYEDNSAPGKTEVANGRRIERWTISNTEPVKLSLNPTMPLFAISSLASWDAFGDWIRSLNQKAVEPTPEISALASKLITNKSTDRARIAALYAYVATKIRYLSINLGAGRVQPHAASAVLHNAYGDCKDQSALLAALLRAAGFKSYAVLTTPGLGVSVPEVPLIGQFNHEFTAIDTKSGLLFVDTSMGPVQMGVLQPGVRGRKAFLVGDSDSSLIDIPIESPVPQRAAVSLKGRVNRSGAFEGSTRLEFQGLPEALLRRAFLDANQSEKEQVLKKLAGPEFTKAEVRQLSSSDPGDLTGPFWVQGELSDTAFFPAEKNKLDITLDWPSSLDALSRSTKPDKPLPLESVAVSRSMDVMVDSSFVIGNGLPVHLTTPFGTMNSEFSYDQGHLILKRSFALGGRMISPEDWDAFVKFMRAVHDESQKGFSLERRSPGTTRSAPPAQEPSPLAKLLRDGETAYDAHDYEGAKRAYLEATKLDPQNRVAWNNLGLAYNATHEYQDAEQAFKRQIEINPDDAHAYNNLGLSYRSLKRNADAIASFREQISHSPRDRFAHFNLATALAAERQWDEARQEAAIAAEISPEDSNRWVLLGKSQVKSGFVQEGRASFRQALEKVHDPMIENNVAYALADAGIDLDKNWNLISGLLESEAHLACQPETLVKDAKCDAQLRRVGIMLDTAGWVLFRQGKPADALPYLSSAYAIRPNTEVEFHFSAALAKLGKIDESLSYFAKAQSRADFSSVDSDETRRGLAMAVGGNSQLAARLEMSIPNSGARSQIVGLVDAAGKVLDTQTADSLQPQELVSVAKTAQLLSIVWPEHSLRSVRTIEYVKSGEQWLLVGSYAGQPVRP